MSSVNLNASVNVKTPVVSVNANVAIGKPQTDKWESGKPINWQVRIHVIEARDLHSRDANGMSDPVAFVTVLGKKKHTATHKKTLNCTFDHLMFFEFQMTPEEFFHGKAKLEVFDANSISRGVEIGTAEIDLGFVYNQQGHEVYRTWLALTDKSGRHSGIQGYLRATVVVLGPKDEAIGHEESEEIDQGANDSLQSMILMPPSVQSVEHSLELNIFRAEGLPKMDTFGKCDGYVAASFAGSQEIKTEIIQKEYNPVWLECLTIPTIMPTMSDLIKIQVRDWDNATADEIVGTSFLSLSELTTKKVNWKTPRWVNIYGIPDVTINPGKETTIANQMNEGHIAGTAFRGRVLMSMDLHPTPNPKLNKHKINNMAEPPTEKYILRFDLLEATELQTKSDVSIEISIGTNSKDSKKAKVENGNASWYASVEDQVLVLPSDKTQIPDIFINVYQHSLASKKRLGFIRVKATEIKNSKLPQWAPIEADVFGSADKNRSAGYLQYRMDFGSESQMFPRPSLDKPVLKNYQLRAHIYQGKELPAGDSNGLSDPYCIVRVGKYSKQTKTIKSTLFPIWYETLVLPVQLPENLQNAPEVHVSIFDYDTADPDDFLGKFSIPVASISDTMLEVPRWYNMHGTDPTTTEGSILASFQLIPQEKADTLPIPNLTPSFKECTLEINAVGLRDLLPYAFLPATNPYIEFDCGTDVKVRTKTSSNPGGSNPNYLETLQLKVKVPENRVFCPPLNIRVYDDRVIHKPLLGARALPLSPFIPFYNKTEDDIAILKEDQTPVVDRVPGALVLGNEEVPKPQIEVVVPDDKEAKLKLLQQENKDLAIADAVINNAQARTLPQVKESMPEGAPVEKEASKERETIKWELEHDLQEPPFTLYKLFRAKKFHGKPVFVEAGEFKGRFRVVEGTSLPEDSINLTEMYKPKEYVVRIYVLEAFQLVPKDLDGNNPYIRISNGKTKIKDSSDVKQKTSRPQFYKVYELNSVFPQQTTVELSVWDWDPVTDELIGTTRIDLENRFYSNQWKSYGKKPIEYRTLWNPSSSNAQGQIKLWVDILTPEEAKAQPPEDIAPPVPTQYELRVIVWETRKVALKDKQGKSSDIFVCAFPEGQEPQPTETHWKCEDGNGKFNWRLKFPVTLPTTSNTFKLQVWDRNVLEANAVICEANLNLRSFYAKTIKNKSRREILPKQWIAMTHPERVGVQGEVSISVELLLLEEANRNQAGFGREDPNLNPTLPKPDRPETSFAPWDVKNHVDQSVKSVKKWYGGLRIKLFFGLVCLAILAVIIVLLWLKSLL